MNISTSNPIEEKVHLKLVEDLLLIFMLLSCSNYLNNWWHIKLILITSLLLANFTTGRAKFPKAFWTLTLFLATLDVIPHYFLAANHSFVVFYSVLIILISHFYPLERTKIVKFNSLFLLILIMLLGGIQKLLSPDFMSGDFLSYMTLKGELFKPLQIANVLPDVFSENSSQIITHKSTVPDANELIYLKTPFSGFEKFIYYFSIFVMILEFLIIPTLFLKVNKLKHLILLSFLISLILTRFETGFVALLTILIIGQLPVAEKNFKILYLLVFMGCLALIMVRLGFL